VAGDAVFVYQGEAEAALAGATIRHFNGEKAWERVPMAA
jgi:hypothetical protein